MKVLKVLVTVLAIFATFFFAVSYLMAKPDTPQNFIFVSSTPNSIIWAWDAVPGFVLPSDGGYQITDRDGRWLDWVDAPNTSVTETTALSENVQYTRMVVSYDLTEASDPSNEASGYTKIHNPTVDDFSLSYFLGEVRITVTPPLNHDVGQTGVLIEIDTWGDGSFTTFFTVQNYWPNYLASDPHGSGTYYYRIRYRNAAGETTAYSPGRSIDLDATDKLLPPSNFTGTATAPSSITWSWDDHNFSPNETKGYRIFDENDLSAGTVDNDVTSFVESSGLVENRPYTRYGVARGHGGIGPGVDQAEDDWRCGVRFYADSRFNPAQSFKPSISSTLTKVEVNAARFSVSTADLKVEICLDSGGFPGAALCEVSITLPPDETHDWREAVFASPPALTAGETYWIKLSNTDNYAEGYLWAINYNPYATGEYPNGHVADYDSVFSSWTAYTSDDFVFRTYMNFTTALYDSDKSNYVKRYTLVTDPVTADFTVTPLGNGEALIEVVTKPYNSYAGLTGAKIERGTFSNLSDAVTVMDFDAVYSFTDTVPTAGTFYYGVTLRNGDGIETARAISAGDLIPGPLAVPAPLSGAGISTTQIRWSWTNILGETGYLIETSAGIPIALLPQDTTSYDDTVAGENSQLTRQLRACLVSLDQEVSFDGTPDHVRAIPWNTGGAHAQYIYTATDMNNSPGAIKKIYWKCGDSSAGQETYYNVSVRLGHSTLSELSDDFTANFTEGDATEVRAASNYTVSTPSYGAWVEIPITGTFLYDGANSLIVDIRVESGTGDIKWSNKDTTADTMIWAQRHDAAISDQVCQRKYLVKFNMDVVISVTAPAGPATAYSLVHDALPSDFTLRNPGGLNITVEVNQPPNAFLGQTGVKIERDTDIGFASPDYALLQGFTAAYSYNSPVLAEGTYYYRITYCNGDTIPTASAPAVRTITLDSTNNPPTAAITSPTGGTEYGNVDVAYILADAQESTCSIAVQWKRATETTWHPCSEGPGSDGITGLTTDATGISYTFVWATIDDGLGETALETVQVRITPNDGSLDGTSAVSNQFDVDNITNTPPAVLITSVVGTQGDIDIAYTLTDAEDNACSIYVQWKPTSGDLWQECSQGSGGDPVTGLTADATGISHTFVWDSFTDGAGMPLAETVQIRIMPNDGTVNGDTVASSPFTVDNTSMNSPPVVSVTTPASPSSGNIPISYDLADDDSDTCSIIVEYTTDGITWLPCTAGGGDGVSGLSSSPAPGTPHTFVWNSVSDIPGIEYNVQVRITPSDPYQDGTPGTTSAFKVDNGTPQAPPVVTVVLPTAGIYTGDIVIKYDLADVNGDACTVTVEYDDGLGWKNCTPASGFTNPQISVIPGTDIRFIWDSSTDLPDTMIEVTIRVTADDGNAATGGGTDSATSANFEVNNAIAIAHADFTASPTYGDASLEVQFTDMSVGTFNSWAWDFDGDSVVDSTVQNPTYTYTLPGLYTVRLSVGGLIGSFTETKEDYIEVTGAPTSITADFTASTTLGAPPFSVDFTDTSTGAPAIAWSWDFDGDSVEDSILQNPTHIYNTPGTYDVTLTVTAATDTDSITKPGLITVTGGGILPGGSSGGGGCSCSISRKPAPLNRLLGYFVPAMLVACAWLALRRRNALY